MTNDKHAHTLAHRDRCYSHSAYCMAAFIVMGALTVYFVAARPTDFWQAFLASALSAMFAILAVHTAVMGDYWTRQLPRDHPEAPPWHRRGR